MSGSQSSGSAASGSVVLLVDALGLTNGVSMTAREIFRHWTGSGGRSLKVMGTGSTDQREERPFASLEVFRTGLEVPKSIYPDMSIGLPLRRMLRSLEGERISAVHLFTPGLLGVAGLWLSGRRKAPLLTTHHTRWGSYFDVYALPLHGILTRGMTALMRHMYRCSAVTVVHSPGAEEEASEMGARLTRFLPMGVTVPIADAESLDARRRRSRLKLAEDLGLDPSRRIAVSVGRLGPEKNLRRLVQIAQAADVLLLLVGTGPLRDEMAAERLVIALGERRGEALSDLYFGADLFVTASLTETLGKVMLEALAHGTPILVPDTGFHTAVLPRKPPFVEHFDVDDVMVAAATLRDALEAEAPAAETVKLMLPYDWNTLMPGYEALYGEL